MSEYRAQQATRSTLATRAALASVLVAVLLLGLKAWAAWSTASMAMLGSLADTALDLIASVVTLAGVRIAALPADHDHRFGHGKAEALVALVQIVLITLSAGWIGYRSVERLMAAYDDPEGVTAIFNLNLLERINRELGADIPVEAFRHRVIWNDILSRIEMHLEATRDVRFTIAGHDFAFAAGQTIHTENSHKFGTRDARILLRAGGWTPVGEWTDPEGRFAVLLAEAQPARLAP